MLFRSNAGYVMGRWAHTNRRGDQTQVRSFGDLQNMGLGLFHLDVRTFDVDVQHSVAVGERHGFLLGGGFRRSGGGSP